ncbi:MULTISPECIES: ribosome biogenesis factor YjgA [unclassified Pseudoalteromonas]|uniref:ribosome biogenesis factor YjgA n=1 Tax=unclassified Pseudoalteromonas TaxID=194690 RepID=UPI000CF62018|nr:MULTISPECIES: ribosome biogenesis factor YjgA [unclassified Pseudoalteromonas]
MAKKPQPEEEIIYVSKSELKRDAMEYHELGIEIANLSKKQREKLPLSPDLEAAMDLADRLKDKKDAYRRHLNYIAKTLRSTTNVEDIHQAMAIITNKNNQKDVIINHIEQTRDDLIAQGDAGLNPLLETYPQLERQRMRQLIRQAAKEVKQEKPGKAFKELFQILKDLML